MALPLAQWLRLALSALLLSYVVRKMPFGERAPISVPCTAWLSQLPK
jgi:hypothetical protein